MVDEDTRARMAALEKRLAERKRRDAPPPKTTGQGYSGAEVAYRMVIELVTGLVMGLGIGYGLDSLFGTMPIFLVLFVFVGLAAGINVMMRTAKDVKLGETPPDETRDDDGAERSRDDS
ncbi:AtpZ/AtpI family protein [Palleronia abyssalis]|uniref:ATP synthase protein I n=1 Tax=Palleronia abyssalis TaxID=1501240 RepID=A0A2R8BWB4_9RHOB|nr:AtpZ/AtpI family protein [Palleronia abyssalis]SPJ24454.1 ATP synthase protein I [Palleronia abyssalis]